MRTHRTKHTLSDAVRLDNVQRAGRILGDLAITLLQTQSVLGRLMVNDWGISRTALPFSTTEHARDSAGEEECDRQCTTMDESTNVIDPSSLFVNQIS